MMLECLLVDVVCNDRSSGGKCLRKLRVDILKGLGALGNIGFL